MSTHINAKKGDFAKVVLMPGDPLRAKWIADNFLTKVKQVNNVRGILAFTGYSKNNHKRVSVMASGMGMPSIGIYSYELFKEYNVETIIRVGTCGGYSDKLGLGDIVIAMSCCSDFNYSYNLSLPGIYSACADYDLLESTVNFARKLKYKFLVSNVLSVSTFYDLSGKNSDWKKWLKVGVSACEMETYALYTTASVFNKRALGIFTVSDHFNLNEQLSQQERQTGLIKMINLAIMVAEKFS